MTCLSNIESGLPAVNEWDQLVSKIGAMVAAVADARTNKVAS
jgi:hypothetical protein